MLLNSLKADESSNQNLYQSPPHAPMPQHHQQIQQHAHSSHSKMAMHQNMPYQQHYQQQQQHNYSNFAKQQFQANAGNFQNQSFGAAAAASSSPQLISQIPPNTNPMDYFQKKMQTSSQAHHHQPQIPSKFRFHQ